MPTGILSQIGVLLVEDDDDDAFLVEEFLSDGALDVQLTRARTVREALGALPGEIECVLLDLGLPDGLGVETVGRVRAAAPRIAVIVLTGLDNEAAGESAVDAGAQDYLVKGKVDGGLLARAIRYAVGRRHAEDVQQQLRVAEIQAEENARLERGLVPHPIVNDPAIWIESSYLPGRRRALLGGDFYDAVETTDGCLHLVVGDVSGRGPDEAALGAGLRHFAVDGALRMQVLINDLLAFSRAGRGERPHELVELAALVDRARAALSETIAEAGATVTVSELPMVSGDAALLTSVFQNLIANAVKFRGSEAPVIRIDAHRRDDCWEFRCADNGIGIEPEYAERIFLIFQRLHPRTAYPGTGIGLAMCRKIVEYHGGRIWLDTSYVGGACVRFTLPIEEETGS